MATIISHNKYGGGLVRIRIYRNYYNVRAIGYMQYTDQFLDHSAKVIMDKGILFLS